jgi:hypothetical protein
MSIHPGPSPIQLQVNLAVARGHYADAVRPHLLRGARAAQFAAVRDIPDLIREIERLRALVIDAWIRNADLRAALATMAAREAVTADQFSRSYSQPSPGRQRGSAVAAPVV